MVGQARLGHQRLQHREISDQYQGIQVGIFRDGQPRTFHDLGGAEIASHCVHGNPANSGRVCHYEKSRRVTSSRSVDPAGVQTSTVRTWRPRYMPLFGLTRCGRTAPPSVGSTAS